MVRKSAETESREDALKTYLDGIGQFPLLTAEDEVDLAMTMERAAKAREALEASETLSSHERVEAEAVGAPRR